MNNDYSSFIKYLDSLNINKKKVHNVADIINNKKNIIKSNVIESKAPETLMNKKALETLTNKKALDQVTNKKAPETLMNKKAPETLKVNGVEKAPETVMNKKVPETVKVSEKVISGLKSIYNSIVGHNDNMDNKTVESNKGQYNNKEQYNNKGQYNNKEQYNNKRQYNNKGGTMSNMEKDDISDNEKMRLLEKEFNEQFMYIVPEVKHINLDNINDSHNNASNSLNSIEKRKELEDLFNKQMAGQLSEPTQRSTIKTDIVNEGINHKKVDLGAEKKVGVEKKKSPKEFDALKYESRRIDKMCIRPALNGFSKNKLCILDMDKFLENFKTYIPHNIKYKTFIIYKNQNTWYLLTKKSSRALEYKHIKFLKICLNQFIEGDKFKKIINNSTYRCCYLVYNLDKITINEIELVVCTKVNNNDL